MADAFLLILSNLKNSFFIEHLQMTASIASSNGNYMIKVNNRNTGERCEMRSKLKKDTKTAPLPLFSCLSLNIFYTLFQCSIVNFEHVNAGWDNTLNVLLQNFKSIPCNWHVGFLYLIKTVSSKAICETITIVLSPRN